jgi:DNA-binding transcriptional MerR regulator
MQGRIQKALRTSRISKRKQSNQQALPAIPDKRYFTIGEVARLCAVKPHVLRYWEQEFPQLSPVKRRGNRRYYQQHDVMLIRQIRQLLYDNGFTIEGARAQLSNSPAEMHRTQSDSVVKKMILDLEDVLKKLKTEEI